MNDAKPCRLASAVAVLGVMFALAAPGTCAGADADDVLPMRDRSHASSPAQAGRVPLILPRSENFTYFTIAADLRLCPSPLCGGFWVTRVNQSATVCVDGALAPSCYVADLDLSRSGLSESQEASVRAAAGHLLMRGSIGAKTVPPFGILGVFEGREAWLGHDSATAAGTFYRARDTGIVCVAYPCENVQTWPLNRRGPAALIAGVDLGAVSANPEDGYAQLDAPHGLIASGEQVAVSGPAGNSVELRGSEYFVRVVPDFQVCEPGSVRACGRKGFCDLGGKAQCGRANVPGVCALRPQACIALFDPVCGCDGTTYGNACAAHAAGIGVDHGGPCP